MLIHTVVAGETLRDIAGQYVTTAREIVHLNELSSQEVVVPGMHLLVPAGPPTLAQAYTVQNGDTLQTVARRAGVTTTELQGWLGPERLAPGTRVYVPRTIQAPRTIEVNGYLLPQGKQADAHILHDVGQRMTYVCIFSYQARADGSLLGQKDTVALSTARQIRVAPLMTVTNFDGQGFNTELAHTILANGSIRRRLTDNVIRTCRSRGFRGVNIDFEHMRHTDRQLYNQFVRELATAARQSGLTISIAMGPKTSDEPTAPWMGAFDYPTLGQEVDFLMLMTYEWGWVGGPPMAGI